MPAVAIETLCGQKKYMCSEKRSNWLKMKGSYLNLMHVHCRLFFLSGKKNSVIVLLQ